MSIYLNWSKIKMNMSKIRKNKSKIFWRKNQKINFGGHPKHEKKLNNRKVCQTDIKIKIRILNPQKQ